MMLHSVKLIFWDFDGVIKDSVEVKTQAFVKLFHTFGVDIAKRVHDHHEANGGMSRFDKLPMYLQWAGMEPAKDRVIAYCDKFSQLVLQGVIDAPWVPGAEDYLRTNPRRQTFVLVSATPQEELERILQALDLRECFKDVFGAPTTKTESIRKTLNNYNVEPAHCLMIGDAKADRDAAQANQVPFLLRRHATNMRVFEHYNGDSVEDFIGL